MNGGAIVSYPAWSACYLISFGCACNGTGFEGENCEIATELSVSDAFGMSGAASETCMFVVIGAAILATTVFV
jgi:hypothetical protein